jgi:hypothetical protein
MREKLLYAFFLFASERWRSVSLRMDAGARYTLSIFGEM